MTLPQNKYFCLVWFLLTHPHFFSSFLGLPARRPTGPGHCGLQRRYMFCKQSMDEGEPFFYWTAQWHGSGWEARGTRRFRSNKQSIVLLICAAAADGRASALPCSGKVHFLRDWELRLGQGRLRGGIAFGCKLQMNSAKRLCRVQITAIIMGLWWKVGLRRQGEKRTEGHSHTAPCDWRLLLLLVCTNRLNLLLVTWLINLPHRLPPHTHTHTLAFHLHICILVYIL